MKIKKNSYDFFEKLLFAYSYFVIPTIVLSLVDKRAGFFSNPEVVGSNLGSVNYFFLLLFFF